MAREIKIVAGDVTKGRPAGDFEELLTKYVNQGWVIVATSVDLGLMYVILQKG